MKLTDEEVARRACQVRLDEPHMEPLKHYARALEAELKVRLGHDVFVPDFDPCDGGIHARCLFLLESPGRRAKHSGFVSRGNPDPTARNWLKFNEAVGLERSLTAIWNIVPWYVGDERRLHAIKPRHLLDAIPLLPDLLALFAHLEVVVLVGKNATLLRPFITQASPGLTVYECPHPGARNINARPENAELIQSTLREVKRQLGDISRNGTEPDLGPTLGQRLTRLSYLVAPSFRQSKGLQIEFMPYPEGEATWSSYRPHLVGEEEPEALPLAMSFEEAESFRRMACGLQLPLVAGEDGGLDGTRHTLELHSGMYRCVLEWWNDLPQTWLQAKPLIDKLQSRLGVLPEVIDRGQYRA